jgi:hypothetical protein
MGSICGLTATPCRTCTGAAKWPAERIAGPVVQLLGDEDDEAAVAPVVRVCELASVKITTNMALNEDNAASLCCVCKGSGPIR